MKRFLLLGQLVLFSILTSAQSITIKRVQLAGEKIIVVYDLEDSNPNNEYLLNLYSSKDNFSTVVTNVTGDVGMDVKPGVDKKMEWNIVKEYGSYKGKLSLEIRGKVYIPFVRLQDFNPKATYRRGKNYQIKWKPGSPNPINIELYKGGQRVVGEVNHPNNGTYELFIPAHSSTGGDYKLKFSDTKSPDEVLFTQPFSVKAKYPLIVKVLPAAIVVGVVVVLVTKKKPADNGSNGETVDEMDDPGFPTHH